MSFVALSDGWGGVGGAGVADGDVVDEVADGVEAAGEGGRGIFYDHGEFEGGHGGFLRGEKAFCSFSPELRTRPTNVTTLPSWGAACCAPTGAGWSLMRWPSWTRLG